MIKKKVVIIEYVPRLFSPKSESIILFHPKICNIGQIRKIMVAGIANQDSASLK